MTDEQFLKGMWIQAGILERAEAENQKARQINRQIKRKERILHSLLVAAILTALCGILLLDKVIGGAISVLIPAILVAMVAACRYDSMQNTAEKINQGSMTYYGGA